MNSKYGCFLILLAFIFFKCGARQNETYDNYHSLIQFADRVSVAMMNSLEKSIIDPHKPDTTVVHEQVKSLKDQLLSLPKKTSTKELALKQTTQKYCEKVITIAETHYRNWAKVHLGSNDDQSIQKTMSVLKQIENLYPLQEEWDKNASEFITK